MEEFVRVLEYIVDVFKRLDILRKYKQVDEHLQNAAKQSALAAAKGQIGPVDQLVNGLMEDHLNSEPTIFTKEQSALFTRLRGTQLLGRDAAAWLGNTLRRSFLDPATAHGEVAGRIRELEALIAETEWALKATRPMLPPPPPDGFVRVHFRVSSEATAEVIDRLARTTSTLYEATYALISEPYQPPLVMRVFRGSAVMEALGQLGSFAGGLLAVFQMATWVRKRLVSTQSESRNTFSLLGMHPKQIESVVAEVLLKLGEQLRTQATQQLLTQFPPSETPLLTNEKRNELVATGVQVAESFLEAGGRCEIPALGAPHGVEAIRQGLQEVSTLNDILMQPPPEPPPAIEAYRGRALPPFAEEPSLGMIDPEPHTPGPNGPTTKSSAG